MNWLLDWLPWWVWPATIGLGLLLTFQFWWPLALTIWNALPNWARLALVGLTGGFLAYLAGRNKGRRNAAEEQRRKDAAAVQKRLEVEQKVQRMTPAERKRELDSWLRD